MFRTQWIGEGKHVGIRTYAPFTSVFFFSPDDRTPQSISARSADTLTQRCVPSPRHRPRPPCLEPRHRRRSRHRLLRNKLMPSKPKERWISILDHPMPFPVANRIQCPLLHRAVAVVPFRSHSAMFKLRSSSTARRPLPRRPARSFSLISRRRFLPTTRRDTQRTPLVFTASNGFTTSK